MKQDIEIAQEARIKPITEIADKLGIPHDDLELYGKFRFLFHRRNFSYLFTVTIRA